MYRSFGLSKVNFVVDLLAFLYWRLFGLLLAKLGEFFFKSSGHPKQVCPLTSKPSIVCNVWENIINMSAVLTFVAFEQACKQAQR
jgi:hypothetical protein